MGETNLFERTKKLFVRINYANTQENVKNVISLAKVEENKEAKNAMEDDGPSISVCVCVYAAGVQQK